MPAIIGRNQVVINLHGIRLPLPEEGHRLGLDPGRQKLPHDWRYDKMEGTRTLHFGLESSGCCVLQGRSCNLRELQFLRL